LISTLRQCRIEKLDKFLSDKTGSVGSVLRRSRDDEKTQRKSQSITRFWVVERQEGQAKYDAPDNRSESTPLFRKWKSIVCVVK
jgi:hypothetical protein